MWVLASLSLGILVPMSCLAQAPATPQTPGMALVAEGKFAEALPLLDAGCAKSPDDPKLGLARAQCLLDLARWKEALAAGQGLLERFPDDADIRVMVGEALFVSFRPTDAVETWRPLLKDSKQGERALPRMLGALLSQRRFGEAQALAVEARAAGVAFDDTALSLAAQACGCPEKLSFLGELSRRHPDDGDLAENFKVERGVCDRGGTSHDAPPAYPVILRDSVFHESVFEAVLNEKKTVSLSFDTGSQTVMLFNSRQVKRLGLPVLGRASIAGLGGRGTLTSQKVLLDTFQTGTLKITNLPATLSGGPFSGVRMGLGPFLDFVVEWDRRKGQYALWPAGTPAEAIFGEKPDITLPVLWFRGIPLVPVSINGMGPFPFLFDTGASNTILAAQLCPLLGLRKASGGFDYTRGAGVSGSFAVEYAPDVKLSIGGREVAPPLIEMTQIPQSFSGPVYGFLGIDFIYAYRVVFDGPGGKIYLKQYPGLYYRNPTFKKPQDLLSRQREEPLPQNQAPPPPTRPGKNDGPK